MSYKVIYKGLEVICDSFEDLDELAEKATSLRAAQTNTKTDNQIELNLKTQTNGNSQAKATDNSQPVQVQDFIKNSTEKTKSFLSVLAESGAVMTDTEVRQILGVETKQQLLGTVSAVYKGASRVGINIEDILIRSVINGDSRNKEFATQIPEKTLNTIREALKD